MQIEQYPVYSLSKNQANRAGKILIGHGTIEEKIDAFEILEQWCVLHAYPLDFYNERLRDLIEQLGRTDDYLVARRIKRIPSIYHKLVRFPDMSFGRMQDLGGIRVIVPRASQIESFKKEVLQSEKLQKFKRECDYVAVPKKSGYRSCHLIYEFGDPDSPKEFHGLNIEVQIRSRIQHAWATTLETFSVFLGHALKSSQGPEDYLTFFEMASAAFSHYENCPRLARFADLEISELIRQLHEMTIRLKVRERLLAFSETMTITYSGKSSPESVAPDKGNYIILKLSPKQGKVMVHTCRDIAEAHQLYVDLEQFKGAGEDIVLVSVSSVSALTEAYPNYFANTAGFIAVLDELFEIYC